MPSSRNTVNIFDPNKKPIQIVFALAWPIFIENILSTLLHYVDAAMVGQLGAYATAAVSLLNQAMFLITGAVLAMGVGITALVARSIGAEDIPLAKKLTRHAVLLSIYLGIPMCIVYALLCPFLPLWLGAGPDVAPYATNYNLIVACGRPFAMFSMVMSSVLRGAGDTKTPLRINLFSNVVNAILNVLLIYETRDITVLGAKIHMWGAGLGVNGAALATAASMVVGFAFYLRYVFHHPSPIQISIHESYRFDFGLFKKVAGIGVPALFERISNQTAGMLITATVAILGTQALAANTLFNTAMELATMPCFSIGSAATTIVGQYLGAKRPEEAERYVYRIQRYGLAMIIAISAIIYVLASPLIGFFTIDGEVREMGAACLRIALFFQPFQLMSSVFAGGLRGAGDTRSTFLYIAVSNWLLRVAGSLLAIRVFGMVVTAIALFFGLDMTLRSFLFFLRFRSGKWKTIVRM